MREMKDSGVEWIGLIPENWSIYKNKEVLNLLYSGGTPSSGSADYYSDEGTPFITIADMSQSEYVDSTKNALTHNGVVSKGLKILPVGTILYSIYATIGAVSETRINATINQAILALVPKEFLCIKQYYKYNLIAMKDYVLSDTSKNTQANLNADKVKNFKIILPPVIEQRLIADFLDAKCAEIDALTADIEKQIETLEQYKRSVITEAVTKGLNPDAEMKESEVDWIDVLPKNWKTERGKYLFAQKSERGNKESLTLLSPTQNYGVIPQYLYEQLSGLSAVKLNEGTDYNLLKTVHKGAFVISLRSFQGGFEYSEYEGVVSPAYQVFYPTVTVDDRYYKYLFKTQIFIDKMNSYTISLRDGKNIAFSDFGRTYIPLPPLSEQRIIADYLDARIKDINSAVKDKKQQLTVLGKR